MINLLVNVSSAPRTVRPCLAFDLNPTLAVVPSRAHLAVVFTNLVLVHPARTV